MVLNLMGVPRWFTASFIHSMANLLRYSNIVFMECNNSGKLRHTSVDRLNRIDLNG